MRPKRRALNDSLFSPATFLYLDEIVFVDVLFAGNAKFLAARRSPFDQAI